MASTFISLVVGVILAYRLRSVWALVWAGLAGSAVNVALSYVIHPYRPRARLDAPQARELFRFGRWLLGSSVVVFLLNQGDDVLVGKLLGVSALGIYQVAYRISNLPATEITGLVGAVALPAIAGIQDELSRVRVALCDAIRFTSFLAFLAAAVILACAPDATLLILGRKWEAAILPIRILALWGVTRSVGALTGPTLAALGKPDLATKLQAGKLVLLTALIVPLTLHYGLVGSCFSVVLAGFFCMPVALVLMARVSGARRGRYVFLLALPLLALLTSAVVSEAVAPLFAPDVPGVLGLMVVATTVYVAVFVLLDVLNGAEFCLAMRRRALGNTMRIPRVLSSHAEKT